MSLSIEHKALLWLAKRLDLVISPPIDESEVASIRRFTKKRGYGEARYEAVRQAVMGMIHEQRQDSPPTLKDSLVNALENLIVETIVTTRGTTSSTLKEALAFLKALTAPPATSSESSSDDPEATVAMEPGEMFTPQPLSPFDSFMMKIREINPTAFASQRIGHRRLREADPVEIDAIALPTVSADKTSFDKELFLAEMYVGLAKEDITHAMKNLGIKPERQLIINTHLDMSFDVEVHFEEDDSSKRQSIAIAKERIGRSDCPHEKLSIFDKALMKIQFIIEKDLKSPELISDKKQRKHESIIDNLRKRINEKNFFQSATRRLDGLLTRQKAFKSRQGFFGFVKKLFWYAPADEKISSSERMEPVDDGKRQQAGTDYHHILADLGCGLDSGSGSDDPEQKTAETDGAGADVTLVASEGEEREDSDTPSSDADLPGSPRPS